MSESMTGAEALEEILNRLESVERKLDGLITELVLQSQAEVEKHAPQEITCAFCRSAGRIVRNCPSCGGVGE